MIVRGARRARMLAPMLGAALLWSGLSGFAGLGAGPAQAQESPRQVVVDKTTNLVNEVVTVSWSGFRPTTAQGLNNVIIYQCRANPQSTDDCFTAEPFPALSEGNRQIGRTGQDGTGRLQFEVRPAANLPQLACSSTNPCSLLVFENDGVPAPPGQLHPTSVVVPLQFAPSQADCPPITAFDLRTDGAAAAAGALYTWAASLCRGGTSFVLDYTETSSTAGRENFLRGLVDIGITSLAADDEELEEHPNHAPFAYAPLTMTAVAVVVNMRDPFTGNPITDLVLSPRLVMRLITDSNTEAFLSDPELRQLNPTTRFPTVGLSAPLLRAERNAATTLVTTWLASSEEALAFQRGQDSFGVPSNTAFRGITYPRPLFENVGQSAQFLPRTGQRTVALRLFYGVRPNGNSRESMSEIGFIGVVDLPTARRFGLPTARIVNAAGEAVAPTNQSILAGFRAMKPDPHDARVRIADPEASDPAAYPLVMIQYGMVPNEVRNATMQSNYRRVLEFVAGDGQNQLPPGYVPLPAELRNQTRQVAAAITVGSGPTTTAPSVPAPSTTAAPPSTTTPPTSAPPITAPADDTSTTTTVAAPPTTSRPFDPNFGSGSGFGGSSGGFDSGGVTGGFDELVLDDEESIGVEGEEDEQDLTERDEETAATPVPGDGAPPPGGAGMPPPSLAPLPENRSTMILPLLQVLAGGALLAWTAMQAPAAWRATRRQVARWRGRTAAAGATS